jgi:phage repressor protein C with HTH and peptisase S24 domain
MLDIGAKIRALREQAQLSRKALGESISEIEAKINAIEIGRQRIDHEFLAKIVSFFDVDANWLLDDTAEMPPRAARPYYAATTDHEDFVPIQRIAVTASAGAGSLVQSEEGTGFYAFNRRWLTRRGLDPQHLSVISVVGDSMYPELSDGDLVLLDRAQIDLADGRTFVIRFDDELFIKKLQKLPPRQLHLISKNKAYPPIVIDLHTQSHMIQIIGRVVASMHEWI